jgi:Fe2+ transport system protein FeoA
MKWNKSYIIQSFNDRSIALRMLSMGILPGQEIRIISKSPFGYCYYVSIGNRWIAIRSEELSAIDCTEAEIPK